MRISGAMNANSAKNASIPQMIYDVVLNLIFISVNVLSDYKSYNSYKTYKIYIYTSELLRKSS